jgi:hypothetical protein
VEIAFSNLSRLIIKGDFLKAARGDARPTFGNCSKRSISLQPVQPVRTADSRGSGCLALLTSESEEMAVGSDVHEITNEGRSGGNFLADKIASQDLQLFRVAIYDDNSA